MAKKDIVKTEDSSIIPVGLQEQYAADAKANLEHVDDAFFRVETSGSRFKVEGQVIGDGVQFAGVLLAYLPVNIYYDKPFNPDNVEPPTCCSVGGVKPEASVETPQAATCSACPQNRYGTAVGPDGKQGKGKACANTHRLVVKAPGYDLLAVVSLPPTSTKSLNQLMKGLTAKGVPMFALQTVFSFDTNVSYPRPQLAAGELLPADDYVAMRELRGSQTVVAALHAFGTEDVVASPSDEATGTSDDEF